MPLNKLIYSGLLFFTLFVSCTNNAKINKEKKASPNKIINEYGFNITNFEVIRDTIKSGDTFGDIFDALGIPQNKIFEITNKIKDSFDVRKLQVGKPYLILKSKDSLKKPQVFIYEKNKVDYTVIDFRDSIAAFNKKKPITILKKSASGIITSSLSQTMEEEHLSPYMTDRLANIYAWTIDFFRLQKGDKFKVIYTEKFINDSISAGLDEIKAASFEHGGKTLLAFNFVDDSIHNNADFFDEKANNLRRAFLKAPVKFSRISSRYNLKRRIKYYGYKVRAHRGTDFAAPYGTPILATADGRVSKSERKGGNGNYVKIRHNSTYETQYLHMKKRNVKVGDYVKQGDVIGWIGTTGNSGGPHVCYRFWKNGKQVDPFKQDLPASKPLADSLKPAFFKHIKPLKEQLDCISY
ncbi:MAG: peptidoglycan DD-metalloendopeptidase family protein [Flavobacteriales bacterium]